MLYYDLINEKDGVDYGEGKDMVRTSKDISKECHCCNFYYFVTRNFRRHKYFCDGCFFCRIYEKDSKGQQRIINSPNNKKQLRGVLEL